MIICIDFDGTIVEHDYPNIGKPVSAALHYMRQFNEEGAQIILWTMRSHGELREAVEYLKSNDVVLFGINENPQQIEWTTSPKAYGQLYIDDAAYGCPLIFPDNKRPYVDWSKVGPKVLERLKREKE